MKKKLFLIVGFIWLSSNLFSQNSCRELKVSMYPFIPNADNFYRKLETEFEKQNPNINLIINLNYDYYKKEKGILNEEADVYEIDCVILNEFKNKKKIQELRKEYYNYKKEDLAFEEDNINVKGELFVIPHWLCRNFIFYDKSDTITNSINNITNVSDILNKNPLLKESLLIDMKGSQTIGGIYLDLLFPNTNLTEINEEVFNMMSDLLDFTYKDWGRNKDYHNRTGFYQRQFAKGNGKIYVGYSESLYYILDEINNCHAEDTLCIKNISIKGFPISTENESAIGWLDGFAIDSKVNGQKLTDAINFINFMISDDAYKMALKPDYGMAPRYLLPAYKKYYTDSDVLKEAPLYGEFYKYIQNLTFITKSDFLNELINIGVQIDEKLKK